MKKYLLILALVGLFFSCSEMTAEDWQADSNKSWQDYLLFGEERSATVSLAGVQYDQYVVELDTAKNIIGWGDRELATEKGRDAFGYARFDFWIKMGFYFDVEEAGNVAVGSLADCVTIRYEYGELDIDLITLLAKPENAEIDIGDEVFKIKFYSDEAKTNLMDTFTFIL